MPKRLAITIAGAVSLGSYEAGVLWEVLDAIQQINKTASDDNKVLIDVLTGASAGGMTAVIIAQKILYSADEFKDAYDNPLYNTWVKTISLAGLQNTQSDEPALHSLFSSDLIEQISRDTISKRWAAGAPPEAVSHPAAAAALRVGVALTNLNGVAYGYNVNPGGKFIYIDYGDQLTRYIDPKPCDNNDFWEPLREAAVACGAFPVAFRPQDVKRSKSTEPDDYPPEHIEPWPTDPMTFTYSDGGILQNQPLGMAKNLVDLFDEHLHQESRFYLFVSPNAKDPSATDNVHAVDMNYIELFKRLISVVMGQSGFQDWITARGVNEKIALLDSRANGLMLAILNRQIGIDSLAETATSLLKLFFPTGAQMSPGATEEETLAEAQARITKQYCKEIGQLEAIPGAPDAFRDSVLAFETAAGLGARDCMTIYGMTASDSQLAGAGLEAFLGFFDQKFRDHDYDVGRLHARTVLQDPASAVLGLGSYAGSEIREIDSTLNGLKWVNVPLQDQQAFEAGLKNRVHQMLHEALHPLQADLAGPFANLAVDELIKHL